MKKVYFRTHKTKHTSVEVKKIPAQHLDITEKSFEMKGIVFMH